MVVQFNACTYLQHISERETGQNSGTWMRIFRGNTIKGEDVGWSPRKSSLFFLTAYHPEISLSGARV